ncbi:unnamed protein product [Brachionus calyciflorus]|uniref:Gustatory receptor n=1 Tax=Brachionus calyciflorus TaxID=104777 RepID=A0A813WAZ6_9BILA|nr:unnamed protein product [Brachionus calyciflorus]
MQPSQTPSSTIRSSLVHEVHDTFDFEKQLFQGTESPVPRPSSSIQTRTSINTTQLLSVSPSSQKASFFNANYDENGYVFDGVKIDIEDIDNTSVSNITTQSLKRCKSQVLKHYYNLLCFIGWRPFYKEHYYKTPFLIRILNFVYPVMIISLLFYSYAFDIQTCQAKLNLATDTVRPSTLSPAFTKPQRLTTSSLITSSSQLVFSRLSQPSDFTTNKTHGIGSNLDLDSKTNVDQCGHIITTYVLPSLMHLIAYIIGFIYFRINDNEQLYALMEKVFLAVNVTLKTVSQDRVIKRLKIFILIGVFWVLSAMSMNILSRIAFGFEKAIFEPKWLAYVLEALALLISNSVYLAVVINHATQCEMIIFYVNEIRTRLEEKSINLKDAMQQILDIRMSIGNLNSTVSKMTTLVALTFLEKFMIGLMILIINKNDELFAWIYRISFTLVWFSILAFTLLQVARLNSKCCKFKQIALSARVYGYHASNRDELDSFLLFISNAKLRAKLFGIPLRPALILGSLIVFTFGLIILFQTSIISRPDSYI